MQPNAPPGDNRFTAESAILQELASSPLAVAELKKRVCNRVQGLKPKPYQSVLAALVAERKVHGRSSPTSRGKAGKVSSYALGEPPPPPPPARERAPGEILKALNAGPLLAPALKKQVSRQVLGLSTADYSAALNELVAAGSIHGRHKRTKTGGLAKTIESYAVGGQPPDTFIKPVLDLWKKMRAEGIAAGVNEAVLIRALLDALAPSGAAATPTNGSLKPAGTDQEIIMGGVHELLKREGKGALISIRKLRAALTLDKERFDAAVLGLYHGDNLVLHHHDNVGNMSEAERNELVLDKHGNYYVGVALAGGQ